MNPRLHYVLRTTGYRGIENRPGETPTLVFIHGVGSSQGSWNRVIEHLPRGMRILQYDLRGHGLSEHPDGPYALDDFVSDHSELLDSLGIGEYHLVGCSLGGLIAQGVALRRPIGLKSLVLLNAIAGRTDAQRQRVLRRLKDLETLGMDGMRGRSEERWFTEAFRKAHPDVVKEALDRFEQNDFGTYLASYRVLAHNDLVELLGEIEVRTLAITGEFDIGSPPDMSETIAARVQNGAAVIIPDQRHELIVEIPKRIADQIVAFTQ